MLQEIRRLKEQKRTREGLSSGETCEKDHSGGKMTGEMSDRGQGGQ